MADKMVIEILEDGTISISTEGISGQNHVSADKFINEIESAAGGGRETVKKRAVHSHEVNGVKVKHSH